VEEVPETVLPAPLPAFCRVLAAWGAAPFRAPATLLLPELTPEPTLEPMFDTA
jgi:hypothetical protein